MRSMMLDELIADLPARAAVRGPAGLDLSRVAVSGINDDSRTLRAGELFIARVGTKLDGRRFIADAVRAGAPAILTDADPASPIDAGVPVLFTASTPFAAAFLAERFYGQPSSSLDLIGITGTNGKTTTTHLVHQILNGSGVRCGLIGTVEIDDGHRVVPSMLTTPPAATLSRTLAAMVENGCRAAVMESSSHALEQGRVAALRYDVAVFTNLTRDHLDYHGTMEKYAAAKARLFEMLPVDGWAVMNAEDPWTPRMLEACPARVLMCRVVDAGGRAAEAKTRVAPGHPGAGRTACEAVATIRSMTSAGTRAEFVGPWGRFEGTTRMVGRHNVTNALQALAAAWCVGVVPRCLEEQIAAAAAPAGRLEPVTSESHGFAVLVDYAHTDDALEKALATVRPLVERGGRLTVVFGCGGDRDTSKRPLMGAVAARGADAVIVTSDNPRTEAASAIAEQILAGIPASSRSKVTVELDRRVAIRAAVADARRGDVVLIAGKGHEDYQILPDGRGGTIKTVFDDRVVAREALAASTGTRAVGGA